MPQFQDTVWLNLDAKWAAIERAMSSTEGQLLLVAFFEDTRLKLVELAQKSASTRVEVLDANRLSFLSSAAGKTIIFAEHHPLISKGEQALATLFDKGLNEDVACYSALDEPLFKQFNGEGITQLMLKLGMTADEPINSSMVTKSIYNARKKISDKVIVSSDARSAEEWFRIHLAK